MSHGRSVSSHLNIALDEYDHRIRTFVPYYEEMLEEAERLVGIFASPRPTVLDLGIGSGAFSERCLKHRPEARLIGVDTDPGMMEMARVRLRAAPGLELLCGDYLEVELPEADLIGGTISLHHVPEPKAKKALFQRCRRALRPGGIMVMADCLPPIHEALRAGGWVAWRSHLERFYTPEETTAYFEAWSGEDTYFPLEDELRWLRSAGFQPEVTWRRNLFAVVACT